MQNDDIIRMANQIGAFFKAYGPEQAKKDTATHINSYWEPPMRKALLAYVDGGGKGIDDVVLSALPLVKKPT